MRPQIRIVKSLPSKRQQAAVMSPPGFGRRATAQPLQVVSSQVAAGPRSSASYGSRSSKLGAAEKRKLLDAALDDIQKKRCAHACHCVMACIRIQEHGAPPVMRACMSLSSEA